VVRIKMVYSLAQKLDFPRGGAKDTRDGLQESRFTGSIGSDDRDDLLFTNFQCHLVKDLHIAIMGVDLTDS
jgi:hypothetical protein